MILYQFRSVSDPGRKQIGYLFDLLSTGALKFTSPSDFNDPYDCCPTQLNEIPDGAIPNAVGNHMNKLLQRVHAEIYGIVCLTPFPDRMLMWSHYGDQHRGVCVGFDGDLLSSMVPINDKQNPLHMRPKKVIYTSTRPSGDDTDALLKKSVEWSYEDEYRIISRSQSGTPEWGPGIWNISPSVIKEIVIGAEMAPEDKKLITDFIREKRSDIAIKQAVLHAKDFQIVIDPFDEQPHIGPGVGYFLSPNQKWKPIRSS